MKKNRRGSMVVEVGMAAVLTTTAAVFALVPASTPGATSAKAIQSAATPMQAAPNFLTVTFPALTGCGCEIYSGTHQLLPTSIPGNAVKVFGGSAAIQYQMDRPIDGMAMLTISFPLGNMSSPGFGPIAVYRGPVGGALQLAGASCGSGWPGSVTVN